MKIKKPRCNCTVRGSEEYKRINEMDKFLHVLSDRTRLKILCLLKNDELNVKSIYEEIGIKQTLASHHLTQMKKIKLLNERKEKTSSYYSINSKQFQKYCSILGKMVNLKIEDKKCC